MAVSGGRDDADGEIERWEEAMSSGTILCAVNETEGAAEALRAAARLSRRLDMRLVAAYVVEDVALSPAGRREARAGGLRLVDRVLADHGAWTADRRVAAGDPAEQIARIAGEERAELVVVGSAPNGRRARPPLRSRVATELAGMTPIPVVVVPPGRRTPGAEAEPLAAVDRVASAA
jgi:nucleotide-binding universal stress UspA family protein